MFALQTFALYCCCRPALDWAVDTTTGYPDGEKSSKSYCLPCLFFKGIDKDNMNTKRLPWFRMYTDFLNDPKMIAMAFEDQRHFIGVLALKSDGALEHEVEESLLDRIVAQRLWIDHGVIRDVKKRLVAAGLINTSWQPLGWNKRQMQSDKDVTGAERQRRFRDAQNRNALHNGGVTLPDTDIDTEGDKNKYPVGFETVWQTYPDRPGKSKAASFKAWSARLKAGCTAEEMQAGVLAYADYCKVARTEPGYIKQPATFFGPDLHFRSTWKAPMGSGHGRVPNVQPGDIGEIPDAD